MNRQDQLILRKARMVVNEVREMNMPALLTRVYKE